MLPHTAFHCFVLERKQNDYTFWRRFDEQPSDIPGCPGLALYYILLYAMTSLHYSCSVSAGADKTLHLT